MVTQMGGVAYQWSIGIIGLAIANPLQMGIMLAGSAVLGFLVLGEKASWRCITAIVFITVAIVLLSLGAGEGNSAMVAAGQTAEEPLVAIAQHDAVTRESPELPNRLLWPLLGVGGCVFCGLAFALFTVGVRKLVTGEVSPEATVFFISCAGIVFLGPWSMQRLSLNGILATPSTDMLTMLAFGGFNMLAFFLFTKGLQLITVVRANIINNGLATAFSVLAGIIVFTEPASRELILGMVLLLIGIVMIEYNDGPASGESMEIAEPDEV
jgi:drug/metabolite transporter (DMT)-like permease